MPATQREFVLHGRDRHGARVGHVERVESPRGEARATRHRSSTTGTVVVVTREEVFEDTSAFLHAAGADGILRSHQYAHRYPAQRFGGASNSMQTSLPLPVAIGVPQNTASGSNVLLVNHTNASSEATTPGLSPAIQQASSTRTIQQNMDSPSSASGSGSASGSPAANTGSRSRTSRAQVRGHVFGQDPLIETEPPSPSPRSPTSPRPNSYPARNSQRESENVANRMSRTSGVNGTGVSRGRPRAAAVVPSAEAEAGPSSAASRSGTGTESSSSSPQEMTTPQSKLPCFVINGNHDALEDDDDADSVLMDRARPDVFFSDASNGAHRRAASASRESVATSWPAPPEAQDDALDPPTINPYSSSSSAAAAATRELQASVHSALSGSSLGAGIGSSSRGTSSEELELVGDRDGRGRSVRRTLKSTLSVAEHYASALFFGRGASGSGSSSSSLVRRDKSAGGGGGRRT